jgi:hypothetical protein
LSAPSATRQGSFLDSEHVPGALAGRRDRLGNRGKQLIGLLADHRVVDRHEPDLGLAVGGIEPEPVVRPDQRLVEDLLEGIAEYLTGAHHV